VKKSLLALLFVLPAVGCIQLSKTGPLWGKDGSSAGGPTRSKADPKAVIMPARDAGGPLAEEGGPRPPSPTFFVTPAEVNEVNANEIAVRVREEMQRDLNAEFPLYPVMSRIQR
jgi:hypothetical protein